MAETTTLPTAPSGSPRAETYTATQYESSKYKVEGYEYPSDLIGNSSQYGSNYVIFYINVNEESKMIKNKEVEVLSASDQQAVDKARIKKGLAGQEFNKLAVTAAYGLAGGLAGTAIGNILGVQGGGGTVGAAVGVGAAGSVALQTKGSTFSRPQKRLKTAIALHVPNELQISYGAGWGETETFGIQAAISGGKELVSAAGNLVTGQTNQAGQNASQIGSIIAAASMKGVPGGETLSALSGTAPNPKKEAIFNGMDFRSFQFTYQFAPRSSTEAKNVLNIVNLFKYHMHPEYKDSKGFLFLYPSEFDLTYYHGGVENLKIHRHTSCVLTNMNVNYTPNGVFNTFSDGMPTNITVSMTFKELTILTKELIGQGL